MRDLKKIFSIICFSLGVFFMASPITKADIDSSTSKDWLKCGEEVTSPEGIATKTCKITFTVKDTAANYNAIDVTFTTLENLVLDADSIKLEAGWKNTQKTERVLTFESEESSFSVGEHVVGEVTFKKVRPSEICNLSYRYDFKKIERNCVFENNKYYDSNGNIVTEFEFKKVCEAPKCGILENEGQQYYFDEQGKETTKEDYEAKCLEHHYCEKVEDVYYDIDGNVTTEANYNRYCVKHYCEVIEPDIYFNKKGVEIDKLTYEKECKTHSCEILEDGTIYGKNGSIVNNMTYEKECLTNVCRIFPDGTHFDSKGNVVDALNYKKECETLKCEILQDGTIYGANGDIVDEITYKQQCEVNNCVKVGELFYDNEGNVVDENVYNAMCGTIENPKTGMSLPIILISVIGIAGITMLIHLKKYNKFM